MNKIVGKSGKRRMYSRPTTTIYGLAALGIAMSFAACKPFGSSQEGGTNFHPGIAVPLPTNQISAGTSIACLIINGGLECLGNNQYRQLGTGGAAQADYPVPVSGLSSGVTDVSLGNDYGCAVMNGAAYCWGKNLNGEVGNGTSNNAIATPVQVTGLSSGVERVFAGSLLANRACALQSGVLKCWGTNEKAELGNGTVVATTTPVVATVVPSGVTKVALAIQYTCILANGGMSCWGRNNKGNFGIGSTSGTTVTTPTAVAGFTSGVTDIDASYWTTCAIKDSKAYCWGYNASGQIGDGTIVDRSSPVELAGISDVIQISIGHSFTCALTSAGAVYCWGLNTLGQLGDRTTTNRTTPTLVPGLESGVTSISSGYFSSIAIKDGHAQWWGFLPTNLYGRTGTHPKPLTAQPINQW